MFANTVKSIQDGSVAPPVTQAGTNKAATACTVAACRAPRASKDCSIQ